MFLVIAACAVAVLASCDKENSDKDKSPYDKYAVDLGLSVKWATINVGASNEKDLVIIMDGEKPQKSQMVLTMTGRAIWCSKGLVLTTPRVTQLLPNSTAAI